MADQWTYLSKNLIYICSVVLYLKEDRMEEYTRRIARTTRDHYTCGGGEGGTRSKIGSGFD